jgi:protein-disulfide isomerase
LDVVTTIAVLTAAIVLIWSAVRSPGPPAAAGRRVVPVPTVPLSLDGVPRLGSPDAEVVLLAFSDFQCPFCVRFARETLPQLKKRYVDSGKVQLAFRHLPLTDIHPYAFRAAEAAECGNRQGRFWQMHDALFANADRLAEGDLASHAEASGLDRRSFDACLRGEAGGRVKSDIALGRTLGVSSTPVFFVGLRQNDGRMKVDSTVMGARPLPDFEQAIETLLR